MENTNMTHSQFIRTYFTAPTRYIDADGNNDPQCVDIPKLYWSKVYGVKCGSFHGSACKADETTFPGSIRLKAGPSVKLQQGDVIIYAPTASNPYGHVAVVNVVLSNGYNTLEQWGAFTNSKGKKVPGLPPMIKTYGRDKKIQDIWRKA